MSIACLVIAFGFWLGLEPGRRTKVDRSNRSEKLLVIYPSGSHRPLHRWWPPDWRRLSHFYRKGW